MKLKLWIVTLFLAISCNKRDFNQSETQKVILKTLEGKEIEFTSDDKNVTVKLAGFKEKIIPKVEIKNKLLASLTFSPYRKMLSKENLKKVTEAEKSQLAKATLKQTQKVKSFLIANRIFMDSSALESKLKTLSENEQAFKDLEKDIENLLINLMSSPNLKGTFTFQGKEKDNLFFVLLASYVASLEPPSIKVTSYNVLTDVDYGGRYTYSVASWSERAKESIQYIADTKASLYCLIEPTSEQKKAFEAGIPNMTAIFPVVETMVSNIEFPDTTLMYDKTLYKLEKKGVIWLSDTPDVQNSKSFGNYIPRTLVWTQLIRGVDQFRFIFACTHVDNNSKPNQAMLRMIPDVLTKLRVSSDGLLPIILGGDFNAQPQNSDYQWLNDAGFANVLKGNTGITYLAGKQIDGIWISGPEFFLKYSRILDKFIGAKNLSDHYAITAEVGLSAF